METTKPLLIDSREAGKLLQMLPNRVTRLAKRGELPCVLLPDGEYRYRTADLLAWIKEHRRPATADADREGNRDD